VKVLNREELQTYKVKIIDEAKSKLKTAIEEAEKAKPDWLDSRK
jgi:hypothetical protein